MNWVLLVALILLARVTLVSSTFKTLTELRYRRQLVGADSIPSSELAMWKDLEGREKVGDQIKVIQRLQLQLDRSDARSDLTSDLVADKYFQFLSTCLRTPGGAWTAGLGPMEYVGLGIKQHISWSVQHQPPTRILSLPSLLGKMCSCLIDVPSDSSKIPAALRVEAASNKLQDLSLALTRVACRYALLKEQLEEGKSAEEAFALALEIPGGDETPSVVAPPLAAILEVMRLDFGFTPPPILEDKEGDNIDKQRLLLIAGKEETCLWIKANQLQ